MLKINCQDTHIFEFIFPTNHCLFSTRFFFISVALKCFAKDALKMSVSTLKQIFDQKTSETGELLL